MPKAKTIKKGSTAYVVCSGAVGVPECRIERVYKKGEEYDVSYGLKGDDPKTFRVPGTRVFATPPGKDSTSRARPTVWVAGRDATQEELAYWESKTRKPKGKTLSESAAEAKAAKKKEKKAKAKKAKEEAEPRPCLCGCGGTVTSANPATGFLPGHDAKLKGIIKRAKAGNKDDKERFKKVDKKALRAWLSNYSKTPGSWPEF